MNVSLSIASAQCVKGNESPISEYVKAAVRHLVSFVERGIRFFFTQLASKATFRT